MLLFDKKMLLVPLFSLSLTACATPGATDGDGEHDTFGGSFLKADGPYTECELRQVLELVNRSTSTEEAIRGLLNGLSTGARAAANIVAHRNGPDGQLGTGDDDLYDDLDELDGVSYVGPAALDRLVEAVTSACGDVDLSTRPFIDNTTFAGSTGGGWARDSTELEATFTVSGVTGARLREAMLSRRTPEDNTLFERVRKNDALAAFTYDYPVDEIPWDADASDYRGLLPYVALTVESGRFEPDATTGEREISLGTDIMDDTYFDTEGFDLVHRQIVLRGRARWDDPTTIRRILIGAKSGVEVDADGIKSAAKVDVRNDGASPAEVAALTNDVMRGRTSWNGTDQPAEPIRVIYETMRDEGALLDVGGHTGVLLLDPLAHIRSVRSRLHLNEASLTGVRRVHDLGRQQLATWAAAAEAKLATGVSTADATVLNDLIEIAHAVADGSIVLAQTNAALSAAGQAPLSAAELDTAQQFRGVTSLDDVDRHRILAEQIASIYDGASERLDDADRILTGATDDDNDVFAVQFVEWVRSEDASVGRKTVMEPYLARFDQILSGADRDARIAAFNAFAVAQRDAGEDDYDGFVELDATSFGALRPYLDLERNKIHQRQIKTAGLLANALYFDEARAFFVPTSYRNTGNFIIDTTDLTDMLSHAEWTGLTADEQRIDRDLPGDRIFHTTLVNEVQIELGSEAAFVNRIKELREQIAAGTAPADAERMLEGARFVFGHYQDTLRILADLKGDRIRRMLRRAGVSGTEWGPAERSKGETALLMLADEI